MIPEDVRTFLSHEISSTWMLELLLLLKTSAPRSWVADDLVAEMRGSKVIVEDSLIKLASLGVIMIAGGRIGYTAANPHDEMITKLTRIYAEHPLALIKEILAAPNDKIRHFADAFRLKPTRPL